MRDVKPRTNGSTAIPRVADSGDECRSSPRTHTVFRTARVITDTDQGFARVQNISDDGVGLRTQLPVYVGDRLTLELAEGVIISGLAVWTNGLDCGLLLDEQIDSGALLSSLAERARSASARSLRLKVAIPAVTRSANGTRLVEVVDLSQRGMKLEHDGSFAEGLEVKIRLPSGMERRGVVRWSQDKIAGVMFLEPFSTTDLGSVTQLSQDEVIAGQSLAVD